MSDLRLEHHNLLKAAGAEARRRALLKVSATLESTQGPVHTENIVQAAAADPSALAEPPVSMSKVEVSPTDAGQGRTEPQLAPRPAVEAGNPAEIVVPAVFRKTVRTKDAEIVNPQENPAVLKSAEEVAGSERSKLSETLGEEMVVARRKYLECEVENSASLSRLSQIFRQIKSTGNPDVEFLKNQYIEKLNEVKNAELEEVKSKGLGGQELKEAMAGVIHYYIAKEPVELIRERDAIRAEKMVLGERALNRYGAIGEEYSKLSFKAKMGIAGAALGLGALTGGAAVWARQFLAGAGAAYGIRAILNKRFENQWEEDEKKIENALLQEKYLENFELLSKKLEEDIQMRDKQLRMRRWQRIMAQTVGLSAGAAVMVGVPAALFESWGLEEKFRALWDKVTVSVKPEVSVPSTSAPSGEPMAAPAQGSEEVLDAETPPPTASRDASPGTVPATASVEPNAPTQAGGTSAPLEVSVRDSVAIQASHEVSRGDTLTKILSGRLDGLPEGEKERVALSLSNIIQEKLNGMDARGWKDAGFPKGDVDKIYPGASLKLDSLLTPAEIQSVIEGRDIPNVEPRVGIASVSDIGAEGGLDRSKIIEEGLANAQIAAEAAGGQSAGAEADVSQTYSAIESEPKTFSEMSAEEKMKLSDPKEYFREIQNDPQKIAEFKSAVRDLRGGILLTEETRALPGYFYDSSGAGEAEVKQAIAAYENHGSTQPLYSSQVENLQKFTGEAKKVFGISGIPQDGESFNRYSLRIATLMTRTGKKIEGF